MDERNATAALKITFRIGINVGDIIIDGDDIFGGAVNVAARVENESVALACRWRSRPQIRSRRTH